MVEITNEFSNKMDKESADNVMAQPADFETAIAATGYGKFNYMLLLIAIPCCICAVFETTTMSYVLPSAECDLKLTLLDKGVLNAITYAGMISSAFMWGFLSDTLGRKKLLVFGYLTDAALNIMCSLSQSVIAIMVFKFMGGFVICGPFAVLMSYLSELHGLKHRARVLMSVGLFFSLANIILPGLAWTVLPQSWDFVLIEGVLEIHSWQIFLAVCSLPTLCSGVLVTFLPESPKFLMSRGRNADAMRVFQTVFRINSGRPMEEFPIKELINELEQPVAVNTISKQISDDGISMSGKSCTTFESDIPVTVPQSAATATATIITPITGLKGGFAQMAIMFKKPHLKNALLVYTIQFGNLFGLNTFRLWLPQLFTIMTEYANEMNDDSATLCHMLAYKVNKSVQILDDTLDIECEATVKGNMYLNSMIIGIVSVGGYLVAGTIINAIGNKNLLVYGLFISGTCGMMLYWARNTMTILTLSSLYVTIGSISSTALVASIVVMFPTSTRTMTVSLAMMFGRTGALIGNLLFPYFLSLGCLPPILLIGSSVLVCSLICTRIPRTKKTALQ